MLRLNIWWPIVDLRRVERRRHAFRLRQHRRHARARGCRRVGIGRRFRPHRIRPQRVSVRHPGGLDRRRPHRRTGLHDLSRRSAPPFRPTTSSRSTHRPGRLAASLPRSSPRPPCSRSPPGCWSPFHAVRISSFVSAAHDRHFSDCGPGRYRLGRPVAAGSHPCGNGCPDPADRPCCWCRHTSNARRRCSPSCTTRFVLPTDATAYMTPTGIRPVGRFSIGRRSIPACTKPGRESGRESASGASA